METLDSLEAEIFSPALSKTPQVTEGEIFPVLSFPIICGIIQSLQSIRQIIKYLESLNQLHFLISIILTWESVGNRNVKTLSNEISIVGRIKCTM